MLPLIVALTLLLAAAVCAVWRARRTILRLRAEHRLLDAAHHREFAACQQLLARYEGRELLLSQARHIIDAALASYTLPAPDSDPTRYREGDGHA
ncbi:hypothetical protein [Streptomyces olivaceiscleroticus]|uniref:Uncharacterized protein n=1 Tax=Streptomyces olivaceiscleroticus TaxID=68245 RepID=A0ABP3LKF7_9ACTN